jgi:hypothetical protein
MLLYKPHPSRLLFGKAQVFSLALIAFLVPAAHAGHWQFIATNSTYSQTAHKEGVLQTPAVTWSPSTTPSDNSLTLNFPSASVTDSNFGTTPTCDFTLNASVCITATWVADTNSDNTPPTSVWFIENATAS